MPVVGVGEKKINEEMAGYFKPSQTHSSPSTGLCMILEKDILR